MNTTTTHVYFVPGMAAGVGIFSNISLPEPDYQVHVLPWLVPTKKEPLVAYAKRMAAGITHDNVVLIGVSFGGVVAQEMAQFLSLRRIIIISSVKSKKELPRRFGVVRRSLLYKLIPTSLALSIKDFRKLAIGPRTKKRLGLYQTYLSVRDKTYLDWAIENMVCWSRVVADPVVKHIHGDRDLVFPIKYITDCEVIPGGTHVMILYKAKAVSAAIVKLIED
ncbi:MAG: alpha/beta hydrolase [Gilvibacter sp.]